MYCALALRLVRLVHVTWMIRMSRYVFFLFGMTIFCGCRSDGLDDRNLRELFKMYRVVMIPNRPDYIGFQYTGIDDAGMRNAAQYLKSYGVIDLNLTGTQISDASIETLLKIQSIRTLHLLRTQITLNGMKRLRGLMYLETLSIENDKFNEQQIGELQAALPNVQIEQVYWPVGVLPQSKLDGRKNSDTRMAFR
jgi:hypothetical protein